MDIDTYNKYSQALLGALYVTDPDKVPSHIELIKREYFYNEQDKSLFEALLRGERDMYKLKDITKSVIPFTDWLVENQYLSFDLVSSFRNLVLDEMIDKAYNKKSFNKIKSLMEEKNDIHFRDIIGEYKEMKKEFSDIAQSGMLGSSTGIKKLDEATLGLMPNHIWVCGAYYGYGKTFFAINLINSMLEQNKKVVFFSLEMTTSEIIQRLISLRAELSLMETIGLLGEEKKAKRQEAEDFIFRKISERQLVIDDTARDTASIVSKISVENNKCHVDFVALDYIQLLSGTDQYETLREASKNLQQITKQIHCTTLILSQINNEAQRAGNASKVDGFKGAGDIGQIANVAIKIIRDRDQETGEFSSLYGLRLTKVRHGKPCSIMQEIKFPGGIIEEGFLNANTPSESVGSSDTDQGEEVGQLLGL